MDREPAYLELMFRPSVDLVSIVRRFVTEFYRCVFIDPETSSRLALATHELLENAVKYSKTGETRLRVQVARDTTPCLVSIRTWNDATPEDIATLHRVFADLNGAPDAFAFYQRRMRETVQHEEGSGLGIVRIRAEAEMTLNFETIGSTVCISAETFAELRRDDETDRSS
jgi:two-component sensor histidine kinase